MTKGIAISIRSEPYRLYLNCVIESAICSVVNKLSNPVKLLYLLASFIGTDPYLRRVYSVLDVVRRGKSLTVSVCQGQLLVLKEEQTKK